MQRRCGISWRRTRSRRWSWMFGLCATRCQRWSWAIARMCRNMHRRSRGMWTTSTSVRRVRPVRCQRASTATIWCRVYLRMIIGGFSPSWCTTRSTPWPTNRRRLSRRWKPTKRDYRRTTIRRWQPCSQSCRQRAINGGRPGSPGIPVVAAVWAMVAVRTMRSMWVAAPIGGILRSATDATRKGTLHGIVQALHRWWAEHRQRQRQQQRQQRWQRHQLRTIGWQSLGDPLRRRAGTWIVPPLLTFVEINKGSNSTRSIPREKSGRFVTLLAGKRARPPGMAMYDWDFGCQEAENMRLLWETSCMSKEHPTRCPNRGLWIGDCGLSLSTATGSRYTTKRRETVLEVTVMVQEVLWAWHTRFEGYSGWMWRLQERDIEREDRSSRHC